MEVELSSRERIIAALSHQEPDALPIDFGGMRSTGIAAAAYNQLKDHLGIEGSLARLYDVGQQLAEPELNVLDRMGGDVVQVHRLRPSFAIPIDAWKEGAATDGSPMLVPRGYCPAPGARGGFDLLDGATPVAHMPKRGLYFDTVFHPMAHVRSVADIDEIPVEEVSDEEVRFIGEQVTHLRQTTDRAILLAFGGNILEAGQQAWGFERFMVALARERDLVHHWLDRLTAAYLRGLDNILSAVGRQIDVVQFGDDLGMQQRPQISVRMYRELIKPYHQRQFQLVRERFPAVKVFFHSCGSIRPLIPDLIEAGVQILNPIQISAEGMDPRELKREFGQHLVFWGGGADTQRVVPFASMAQIRAHVRELISIFAPGGGYVFTQVHNIQADVPPEKILAIYDTALESRPVRGANRCP